MERVVDLPTTPEELEQILTSVEAGDSVDLCRDGEVVAELRAKSPAPQSAPKRRLGAWAHIKTPTDEALFAPLPDDELRLWYDGPVFPQ